MEKEWNEVYQKCNWGNEYPNEGLIRFIAWKYRDQNTRILKALDAGCGNGTNTLFLAKKGFQVYGFDGSAEAVDVAKGKLNYYGFGQTAARISASLFHQLDYADDYFDLITDIAFLSCLTDEEIQSLLNLYQKKLKSGGIIYCTGLHEENGAYGLDTAGVKHGNRVGKVKEGRLKGEYTHSFFSRAKIEQMFEPLQFTDIQINYFREEYADPKLRYSYFSVFARK
ncbi:class I SAM-dependent methyltransferase [Clostridiales bacterium COT073_COT-073]|nr:class I SAM-dependent methyltransferase [Clostridiales bacterium COT073_COT-073]